MNARARGQTLVLFALTLLVVVLMVLLTLGIGMRTRERVELQNLADTAAYSNAVATSRVYNTIALVHRATLGQMVATLGLQT